MLSTSAKLAACWQPDSSFIQYMPVNTTSADVKGVPSDHKMPSVSVQVMLVKSSEIPPLATVGISSTSLGIKLPSGS